MRTQVTGPQTITAKARSGYGFPGDLAICRSRDELGRCTMLVVLQRTFASAASLKACLAAAVVIGFATLAGAANAEDATAAESASTGVAAGAATRTERRQERRRKSERAAAQAALAAPIAPDVECRSMKVTGSRVPKRQCASRAAWAAIDAEGEENANDLRRRVNEMAQMPGVSGPYRSAPSP